MNEYTFIYCIIEKIIWPLCAIWFLWYFRDSIRKFILSLKKVKYKNLELEAGEEISISQDESINEIAGYLTKSARSFNWFRENTELKYNDEEFQKIINEHSDIFKFTRIIRRDESGNRLKPGYPAIKLKAKALVDIEN